MPSIWKVAQVLCHAWLKYLDVNATKSDSEMKDFVVQLVVALSLIPVTCDLRVSHECEKSRLEDLAT
jgi:hypothetical protein